MLSFKNVEFNYQAQPVFSDLNFDLSQNEFCYVIGKSGAGKSTFLQLIYMNILPSYGRIIFDKYDSQTIKPRELPMLRRKLGIIFQDFKLLRDRNIYENLSFVLEATSRTRSEIKKRVNDALTDVGLSHRRYSMPDELSGGEKQRIAIARAIVNDPMLILADEPTGNLDPETSLEILDIIKKINARGTAVILATHNYELIKSHNAKIIKIEDGKALKVVLKPKQ